MKKTLLTIVVVLLSFEWSMVASQTIKCEKYSVIDSLKYIYGLPDDYLFYPDGDSISSRVISMGREITPSLIEKITDTTKTQIQISDSCYYAVSDVVLNNSSGANAVISLLYFYI